ncbi:MAG: RidA family protein [Alphaproteobacteria bacterium]|nr:MAG: RidA family protein [Alphaproteobacteria bacterium]
MPDSRRLISTGSPMEAEMGYSRAVVQGDWCFMAGVTGYDYATMTLPADPAAQARNCIATIESVLGEAGFALSDVVRVTHYVADRGVIAAIRPVVGAAFAAIRPAATLVVAELYAPEMLVEIEVTAFRG